MAALLAAGVAHASLCEWRVVEYEVESAESHERRAMWQIRRVLHPTGNSAAWDARMAELRGYHADWLACWRAGASDRDAALCRAPLASRSDATARAVALSACEAEHDLAVSRGPAFRTCLAQRGHREARRPRWTRDDFGPRFAGPYVTLFALFAEQRAGAWPRATAWTFGVALPLALAAAALACQSSTCAPSSTTRFGGMRK